jgi:RNA polymerase sigma-70 factor (ECF subfamily)
MRAILPQRAATGVPRARFRGILVNRRTSRCVEGTCMPLTARDDAELVEAARGGDRDAFETLVRRHMPKVYAHALRFFGDPTAAEDATQEVFVKVYRSLSEFDGRSAFATWLYRVTRNVCLDMFRRGRRQASPIDPLDIPERGGGDPAPAAIASVDLERAMRALSPEDRDAFNAVALFGLAYAQASEALGVPAGTVKSRVFRARRTLLTMLFPASGGGA